MACDVCFVHDYDEPSEFYAERAVTARQAHACVECAVPIAPGTRYLRITGKMEDEIWTVKIHRTCLEILKVFTCGGTYEFGRLWRDMKDEVFPRLTTASECFTALSPESKAIVMDRWRAWKGLG